MDEYTLRQWYDVFKDNHELTEIRVIDPDAKRTYSGYFTDIETILREIRPYDRCNIYFTLNTINEACYGREQHDHIVTRPKATTSDNDITARRWCLIDIDVDKPSDTNSTDEEKELAKPVVNEVYKFLKNEGFSQPVICDSANGFHLLYKTAMLSNDAGTDTIRRFLQVLDLYFSTDKVKVDCSTFNASRVCKLYGTVSRKGADTKERPQRTSKILRVPDNIMVTDTAYFAKVAGYLPKPEKRERDNRYGTGEFDIEQFFGKHHIGVSRVIQTQAYTKYILEECPFDSSHRAPDSAVFKMRDGSLGFKCFHNSDSTRTFRDFRMLFEPDAYERKATPPHRQFQPNTEESAPQAVDTEKGNVWQPLSEIEDEDRSKIVSIPSGIRQYDKECCGFDKPSLNIWSGNNGSGKSSLLNQIAINAVDKGFKVAIYSGELRGKRLKRWLVMQAAGKSHNRKSQYNSYDWYTPSDVQEKIIAWLGENLYNYNTRYSHDIGQICADVTKIVTDKGIDMLILDNLSCLDLDSLDSTVNEQQKKAIKAILRLTTELELATHVVIHPKKSDGFLRKNDIGGVKTFSDLADNIFFVHRWNQDTKNSAQEFLSRYAYSDINQSGASNILEVIKQREFGDAVGHIYKLYYEPESRRFKNDVAESLHYGWEKPSDIMEEDDEMPWVQEEQEPPF